MSAINEHSPMQLLGTNALSCMITIYVSLIREGSVDIMANLILALTFDNHQLIIKIAISIQFGRNT